MTNDQSKRSPASLGYRMPAEWEKHEAIWLSWPYDSSDYPDGLANIHKTYCNIIKAISKHEKVNLLVKNNIVKKEVVELLKKEEIDCHNIYFHYINYADIWIRDYGPIFLTNQNENKIAMAHWIFNAWGVKYKELIGDTIIPSLLNESLRLPCFTPGIVLEGGSIDVNGKGTLITTEQCLLNKNRNPNLSKEEIEKCLMEYLGANKVIWLMEGISGDDTDGHVDDVARFVDQSTLLCAYEEDKTDENYSILKNNFEILNNSTDQDGNKLNIIKLPMPIVSFEKSRLPASYVNFYIGNDLVLVPVFNHRNDQKALDIIQNCFPSRKVSGINCYDLVHGLGAIHCVSQQQPAIRQNNRTQILAGERG